MLLNVHRNHKAYEGRGEVGKWVVWRWGKREVIYISLHCHHQNDSSIKMGSDESHFNVPLIVRDKVTRQCSQTTTFEEKGQSKRNGAEALLLTSRTPYRWAKPAHVSFLSTVRPDMTVMVDWALKKPNRPHISFDSLSNTLCSP